MKHRGYDISGPQEDINCVFPMQRLLEMEAEGVIGELAPTAYSFMGLINANTNALLPVPTGPPTTCSDNACLSPRC